MPNEVEESVLSAELEAQIDEAMLHASDPEDEEVAIKAYFDTATSLLVLELKTGQRLAIPQEDLQGLGNASPAELAELELVSLGTAVFWEKLDEGFLVDGLRRGLYGNRRWMEGLAERRRERMQKAS